VTGNICNVKVARYIAYLRLTVWGENISFTAN